MDIKKFVNPPQEYRGMPFWSWNGRLEKQELFRQIHIMKEMGFGGFFMHSRAGLQSEYMGEEWFELIGECAKLGAELGLHAYLYDEDRWPSGSAGGMATKDPRYRLKFITMRLHDRQQFDLIEYGQEYIASFAVKLDAEGALCDYYPVTDVLEVKQGYNVAVYSVTEQKKSGFYNGYTYLDTLNIEATQKFLQLTHERYKEKCGELFGKELIGVFVDEPHRGTVFGGFGAGNDDKTSLIPYTYKLFDTFAKIKGYNLRDKLPEVYFRPQNSGFSKASYDYIDVINTMFIDNFAKPYYDWCRKNKLIVTGHVLHEDSLTAQTEVNGSLMRFYEYMDYPGIDILTEGNRCFWAAKQAVSVSKQLSRPFTLSELYGCTGWQLTFQGHKNVGDWQAALGINFRCHHLSWYTMEGEAKRDFPASIFFQSGWYKQYKYVEDYFARIGYMLSQGQAVTDVLVISPIESVWGYIRKGSIKTLSPMSPEIKRLEELYVQQFTALTDAGVDFDYADEEILTRHGSTSGGEIAVGDMNYRTVLVSGLDTIRGTTLALLRELAKAGGNVVVLNPPCYIDGLPGDTLLENALQARDEAHAAQLCFDASGYTARADKPGILSNVRKLSGGAHIAFFVNTDREQGKGETVITIDGMQPAAEFDLRSGNLKACSFEYKDKKTVISTSFDRAQERMFILGGDILPEIDAPPVKLSSRKISGPFAYTLTEPNIAVLDVCQYMVNGSDRGRANILIADRSIRNEFGVAPRGGEMVQPWYREKYFGDRPEKLADITLSYKFFAEYLPDDINLVCERPELLNITLNGKAVEKRVSGTFIDPCFKVIPLNADIIKRGENHLCIDVEFSDAVNLEAVYLTGQFGVRTEDGYITLTQLPEKLDCNPLSTQGLPFYSGAITVETGIDSGKCSVSFDSVAAAFIEVKSARQSEIVAFCPYNTEVFNAAGGLLIKYVLTRRNTFGPLHLKNPLQRAYGPETFIDSSDGGVTLSHTFVDERITPATVTFYK